MVHLKTIFNYFIFSGFFIALCATAMAFQTALLFRLPHTPLFYGFVFCGTVCSYNFHWALTPKLFQNPMPTGLDAVPLRMHIIVAILGAAGAAVLFFQLRQHWFWLAGAGFLSTLYTAPKIPWRAMHWLQKIAYGKTIFLTLAWTYITALLPLFIAGAAITRQPVLFCINRFFLIYAICILFDLRDRERDKQEGIKSLITYFSVAATDRIYWITLAIFFITSVLLAFYFTAAAVSALLIPGGILLFFFGWFKKQQSDFVYNFILDGLMIFSLPLLLLFRF